MSIALVLLSLIGSLLEAAHSAISVLASLTCQGLLSQVDELLSLNMKINIKQVLFGNLFF